MKSLIVLLFSLICSTLAIASNKCYIQKPNINSVEMWGNVSTKATLEGYMYQDIAFIGDCTNKVNGYCRFIGDTGNTFAYFKEVQVRVVSMKLCTDPHQNLSYD